MQPFEFQHYQLKHFPDAVKDLPIYHMQLPNVCMYLRACGVVQQLPLLFCSYLILCVITHIKANQTLFHVIVLFSLSLQLLCQGLTELFWVDKCLSFSKPHLKTSNSETAGIIRWRGHGHHKWTVRDVLIIEPDGHFVIT